MVDLRGKNRVKDLIEALQRLDPNGYVWVSMFDGDIDLCVGTPWGDFDSILVNEIPEWQYEDKHFEELKEQWGSDDEETEVSDG